MKTKHAIRITVSAMIFMAMGVMLLQCSNEEKVYSVSGIVSYANGIPADGAVVTFSQDMEQSMVINSVVAASDGSYELSGLLSGTYYISSAYNTDNVNNAKKSAGYNFSTDEPVMIEVMDADLTQDISLINEPGGEDAVNTDDGSWRFDKAHSNVNWATAYMGENALLTGKFNSFGVDIDFDEAAPTETTISAWVQLSSANTGEPGRDNLGKCLNGYLGVATDTLEDGSYYVSDPLTDTAYFNSSSVEVWGDGYKANGELTFLGQSKSAVLLFNYIGQADFSAEQDGSNIRGGFSGEFTFNAISDYGVSSTSIADEVTVSINANYRKN